jgi:hypothetical protein
MKADFMDPCVIMAVLYVYRRFKVHYREERLIM